MDLRTASPPNNNVGTYGALDSQSKNYSNEWLDEKKQEDHYNNGTNADGFVTNASFDEEARFLTSRRQEGDVDENLKPHSFLLSTRSRIWLGIFACLIVTTITMALGSFNDNQQQQDDEKLNDPFIIASNNDHYDYIVVGGGPSGILVAYKLALQLKDAKVLLLESGTDSQSSVLQTMQRRKRQGAVNDNVPYERNEDYENDESLNMFDIPLMWSGVASSQGRLMSIQDGDFSVLSPDSWSSHHWPIPLTLLGRGLGGSGLHNAMIYVRSLPSDFSRWNLTGWIWGDILSHYQELETFIDTTWGDTLLDLWNGTNPSELTSLDRQKSPWRGNAGPIVTVPAGPAVDAVAALFVESAVASGFARAFRGFNHPDPGERIGAGLYEFNIRNGLRGSVAETLLGDGNDDLPPNLVMQTGATVTRVLMLPTKRAVGVEYVDSTTGFIHDAMLTDNGWSEVILASGAIMTPQLLTNSGIGENGTVTHLPGVGKNLQDHPVVAMTFSISSELAESSTSIYTIADEMEDYFVAVTELEKNRIRFGVANSSSLLSLGRITSRLGTLATAGFSAGAFLKSPWVQPDDPAPDIQLTVFPRVIEPHVTRHESNQDKTASRSRAMLVTVALLQPDARYQVYPAKLQNTATASTISEFQNQSMPGMPLTEQIRYPLPSIGLPANSTEYLSDRDVLRLAWGMEQVRRILQTPPLSSKTGAELSPGSQVTGFLLEEHVRQHNLPNSHWVGSTKIGTDDDPMAVVDEVLRVRGGVQGLRIVDSGVFPHIPNGNTHSTVCVVASRAADWILSEVAKHYNK